MRIATIAALSALAVSLASCSGAANNSSSFIQSPTNNPVLALAELGLPLPSDLAAHQASAVLEQIDGADFITAHAQHVNQLETFAQYVPEWSAETTAFADLAYALYDFRLDGPEIIDSLELTWSIAPTEYWLGLAHYTDNVWEWHAAPPNTLNLPGALAPYLDPDDDLVLAVVIADSGTFALDRLRVNGHEPGALTNLFFLHHSTGQGIIHGGMRQHISDYNDANGTSFEFWDHCYTWPSLPDWPGGLVDPDGNGTGTDYGGPCDATDPWDLHEIWTSTEAEYTATRNAILDNHEVIAFKSCFPASAISSDAMLAEYQTYYLGMRDVFDTRLDRLFVVMSTPPLHPEMTDMQEANRAREFSGWLKSAEYLDGHPNVVCFDLFDELAAPLGSGMEANMLREEYRPEEVDSHPNALGNQTVAPVLAQFLIDSALAYSP